MLLYGVGAVLGVQLRRPHAFCRLPLADGISRGCVKLNSDLESLGMTDAFGGKADFTPIVPAGRIYIEWVIHQAFVDVDENGTQAAAATVVSFVDSAVSVTPPPEVDLNRTFFFFIRDIATNTLLFVGREDDPTAQ